MYPLHMVEFAVISITQILREIKFGEFKVSKSDILTHLEGLNFDFYEYFALSQC